MQVRAREWMMATRTPTPSRRATIADVAREAGVNKGTVSRALRGMAGVGDATRERIVATAARLDFTASPLATALASGRSHTVGIVLPTLRSWYFSEFAAGASEVLSPSGYHVELINLDIDSDLLDVDSDAFAVLMRELGSGRGRDAMLFAGTISVEAADEYGGRGTVPLLAPEAPLTNVPGVFVDNRAGGRMIAEHLLALGHRRFAMIDGRMTTKDDVHVWQQRADGFTDTVRAAGARLVEHDILLPGDCHAADGVRAGEELLRRRDVLPTAVFCHTDELAFGLLSVLRRAKISCPGQISVAAFDDHPMARFWGLTTVSQHAHEQGVRAAKALIAALSAHPDGGPPAELPVELLVRETTGPAAR